MRFCLLTLRAYKINKKLKRYKHEKEDSLRISKGLEPKYTLTDRHHFWSRCQQNICYCLQKICHIKSNSRILHFWQKLKKDGTFENYIGKSILGFLGGMLLTYVFFVVFILQLQFSITAATLWCTLFGIILTLGLAFSHTVRVVVFLLLPQFFSKRGRQALIAYAFVLAITGPAKNALKNSEIMTESLACGQEQLKVAVREIIDAIKKPFMAIKDAFRKVMKFMKDIVKKIKSILLSIKRIVDSIIRVIKSVFQWLGSIVNICNKKVGTPFQRCQRVFDGAIADCQAKLGPLFIWLCSLANVISVVCYAVKILDFICMFLDFINDSIVGVMKRRIKDFVKHVQNIFYVSVNFKHSFNFETKSNVSMREIAAGMIKEIHERAEWFLGIFDIMSLACSLIFILLVFKVIKYRLKFLISDKFDNHFITKLFIEIDLRRAKNDLETLLPLNKREKNQYIKTKSIRLVKTEKTMLARSAMFLFASTFKLCIIIVADYCLYWVLDLIRIHGRLRTKVQAPEMVEITVKGEGVLADLYRSVVKAFKPLGVEMEIDTISCLPEPIPPDYARYVQIVMTIVLCWILAMLEPYGLRLRYVVMCYYYPARAQQRAVWLYNHILRSRGTYLKYARRQLRRRFGKSKEGTIEKVSLMDRLRALCPFLNIILGKSKKEVCLLCGKVFQEGNQEQIIRCSTPNCPGLYCLNCYASIDNLCTICKKPVEYGDLSDESEEKDSSDDYQSHKKKRDPDADGNTRSRSSSELSYSYQDDDKNDPNANKPPMETRPPFKDVEKQVVHHPATTQIFHVSIDLDSEAETITELYKHPKKIRKKLRFRAKQLKHNFSTSGTENLNINIKKTRKNNLETLEIVGTGDFSSSTNIKSSLETDSESSDYGTVSSFDVQQYINSIGDTLEEYPTTQFEQRTRSYTVMPRSVHTMREPTSLPAIPHDNSYHNASDLPREYDVSCLTQISLFSTNTHQSVKHGELRSSEKENMETGISKKLSKKNKRFISNETDEVQIDNSRAAKHDSSTSDFTSGTTEKHEIQSISESENVSYTTSKPKKIKRPSLKQKLLNRTSHVKKEKTTPSIAIKGTSHVGQYKKDSFTSTKRGPTFHLKEKSPAFSKRKHVTISEKVSSSSEEDTASTKRTYKTHQRSSNIEYRKDRLWTQKDVLSNEDSLTSLLKNESDDESDTWTEMSSGPIPFCEELEKCRIKPELRNKALQHSLKSQLLDSLKKLMPWKSEDIKNLSSEKDIKSIKDQDVKKSQTKFHRWHTRRHSQKKITHVKHLKSDIIEVESISSREDDNSSQLNNIKPIFYTEKEKIDDDNKFNVTSILRKEEEDEGDDEKEDSEEEICVMERKPLISRTKTENKDMRNTSPNLISVDKLPLQKEEIGSCVKLNFQPSSHASITKLSDAVDNSSDESIKRINKHGTSYEKENHLMNLQNKLQTSSAEDKEQPKDLPKHTPVPGQRPLYDFDALSYQGHESYFDLVNELENELKRRREKKREQQDRIPPDLIQSGIITEDNNIDRARSRPTSSYDFRFRPTLTMLPPDIVPSQHHSVQDTPFRHSPKSNYLNQSKRHGGDNWQQREFIPQPSNYQSSKLTNQEPNHQETESLGSINNFCYGETNMLPRRRDKQEDCLQKKGLTMEPDKQTNMEENNFKNSKLKESPHTPVMSHRFQNSCRSPREDLHTHLDTEGIQINALEKCKCQQGTPSFETSSEKGQIEKIRGHKSLSNDNDHDSVIGVGDQSWFIKSEAVIYQQNPNSVPQRKSQHILSESDRAGSLLHRNSSIEELTQPSRRKVKDYIALFTPKFNGKSKQSQKDISYEFHMKDSNQTQTPRWRAKQQPASKQKQTSSESAFPSSSTSSTEGQTEFCKENSSKQHHKFKRCLFSPRTGVRYYHQIGTISEEDEEDAEAKRN